jgi:palmitoyltransferase ZDHHC9/14/18
MANVSEPHTPTTPTAATVATEEETPRAATPSTISRMTDAGTTDGDTSIPPTGTPSQGYSSPNQGFRRGLIPTRSNSNAAASSHTNTRPGSASSRVSRRSRNHVSSLTPQAFFRPMSSQRLQAHRSGRPMTQEAATVEDDEDESENKRISIISNSTLRHAMEPPSEAQEVPPSRGTEFTDPVTPDRNTSNASPTGNATIRSLGESVRLLQEREKKPTLSRLSISNSLKPGGAQDPSKQSPLSLRSGFLSPRGRTESQDNRRNSHHERLSSAASSPRFMKGSSAPAPPRLGKNYEYFTGNTVFWGSGRFQNSRDKPVNIITGILVILPAGLFFGYSYVFTFPNLLRLLPN